MPDITDDVPRLAEIARSLQDFRSEFRTWKSGVVSKDVYEANMRTIETRIEAVTQENRRLNMELEKERTERARQLEKEQTERRTSNGKILFAMLGAALSLLVGFVQVVAK